MNKKMKITGICTLLIIGLCGFIFRKDLWMLHKTEKQDLQTVEFKKYAFLLGNLPNQTYKKTDNIVTVTNPDSPYVLVNKHRNLPRDYVPSDLVTLNVPFYTDSQVLNKQLRKPAAEAFEKLFAKGKKAGIMLYARSGYRSYQAQETVFGRNAEQKGNNMANKTSALPGQSEHQTGLALDVTSRSVNNALVEAFAETAEGKWLAEHAAEYGFIIRFLKGKEKITGYTYEPWHIRYVGTKVAKEVARKKMTLEEYFEHIEQKIKRTQTSER